MFAVLRRPAATIPVDAALSTLQEPGRHRLQQAIQAIAGHAGSMGREAAEVRGVIEDTTKAAHRSAEAVSALARQVAQITEAQQGIVAMTQGSHAAVASAREAVEGVGREVTAIVGTLREVAQAAGGITQIALQTRLVAFNASGRPSVPARPGVASASSPTPSRTWPRRWRPRPSASWPRWRS